MDKQTITLLARQLNINAKENGTRQLRGIFTTLDNNGHAILSRRKLFRQTMTDFEKSIKGIHASTLDWDTVARNIKSYIDAEISFWNAVKDRDTISHYLKTLEELAKRDYSIPSVGLIEKQLEPFFEKIPSARIDPDDSDIVFTGNIKCDIEYDGKKYDFGTAIVSIKQGSEYPSVTFYNDNEDKLLSSAAGLMHPHVRSGTPCLGGQYGRYKTLVRNGLIYDAFKIVEGCLNTYFPDSPFEKLYKFSPAEYWKKKKGKVPAGSRCIDCGSSYVADNVRCEDCGSYLCEYCVCHCESCQMTVCSGCSNHTHADGRLCNECFSEAGYFYCHDCGEIAEAGSDGGYCNSCGNDLCDDCAEWHECDNCGERVCNQCADAQEGLCGGCYNSLAGKCNQCEKLLFSGDEIYRCSECEEILCEECAVICVECKDVICSGHSHNCSQCGEPLCSNCGQDNGDGLRCSECAENENETESENDTEETGTGESVSTTDDTGQTQTQ